jgi:hypothetical protein
MIDSVAEIGSVTGVLLAIAIDHHHQKREASALSVKGWP